MVTPPTVSAEEVRIGIGFAVPPYVIRGERRGLEVDIIRESLALAGHEALFQYLPNRRLPMNFAEGKVDCVATHVGYDMPGISGRNGFSSDQTIVFQNYAISLQRDHLVIHSVSDLYGKQVLAFQGAPNYLGPDFARMTDNNPLYFELADQSLQVRMLLSGRVQVLISDKRVFTWWQSKLPKSVFEQTLDVDLEVAFHPIFPASPRHVFFARQDLRDDFNKGLQRLKANGRFDAIMKDYAKDRGSDLSQ